MLRTPVTTTLRGDACSAPTGAPGRIGRYAIEHVLGAGGTGTVYLAGDTLLGRRVALKLFRADAGYPAWVEREAQALARLRHPNVVSIYDVGVHHGQLFLAMEFVDGGTLRQWLETPRSVAEIVDAVSAAGRGLAAAHAAGLVHRDFKIDNVLVACDGRVLVSDFGLAVPLEVADEVVDEPGGSALGSGTVPALLETTPDWFAGTPGYAAPETYCCSSADPRADQFSLGVTLYRCLYGRLPYNSRAGWRSSPPLPSAGVQGRVPLRVRRVLRRSLSIERQRRFADIPTLLRALAPPVRSRQMAAGLAAAGVLAALGFALAGARFQHREASRVERACLRRAATLSETWNPATAARLANTFRTSAAPYAVTALAALQTGLDGYATRWRTTSFEVCSASGAAPDEQERRGDCLATGARQFATLVEALLAADDSVVATSAKSVGLLPDPRDCAAPVDQLTLPLLPVDPGLRREVSELRRALAEARALLDVGRLEQARARMSVGASRVEQLGDLTLTAQWRAAEVSLHYNDAKGRERALLAALWAAEASGSDSLIASALLQLVEVVGYELSRLDDALVYVRRADAVLRRMREPLALRRGLQLATAHAWFAAGHDEEALPLAEAAAVYFRREATAPPDRRVFALLRLGALQRRQGRYQAALTSYRAAAEIADAEFGPGHPAQAGLLNNLGWLHAIQGDVVRAGQLLGEADHILIAAYGTSSPHRIRPLTNLAWLANQRGEPHVALGLLQLVIELRGTSDSERMLTLARIGGARCALGMEKQGRLEIRRALARMPAGGPAQQVRRSAALLESATCHLRRGAQRAASRDAEAALAAARDTGDRDQKARAYVALAEWSAVDDPRRARQLLRELEALATTGDLPADLVRAAKAVSSLASAQRAK